jgi:hypothetical protein
MTQSERREAGGRLPRDMNDDSMKKPREPSTAFFEEMPEINERDFIVGRVAATARAAAWARS